MHARRASKPEFVHDDEDSEEESEPRAFLDASSCSCRKHTHCAVDEKCGGEPGDCGCEPSDDCTSDDDCGHLPGRQFCIDEVCQGMSCGADFDCPGSAICVGGACFVPETPESCEALTPRLWPVRRTSVGEGARFVAAAVHDEVHVAIAGDREMALWRFDPPSGDLVKLDEVALASAAVGLAAAPSGELRFAVAQVSGVTVFETVDGALVVRAVHDSGCEAWQVRMMHVDVGEHADVVLWTRCPNEDRIEVLFDEHLGLAPVVTPLPRPARRAGRGQPVDACSNGWYEFDHGELPRAMTVDWRGQVEVGETFGRPLVGHGTVVEEAFVAAPTWYGPEPTAGGVFVFSGHHGTRVLRTSDEPRWQDDRGPILVPTGLDRVDRFWFSLGRACRQTFEIDSAVDDVAGFETRDYQAALVLAGGELHVIGG